MKLYPWQEVAIKAVSETVDRGGGILIVAPTGAGKTHVAFKPTLRVLSKKKIRIIYTAPTRALALERYLALRDALGKESVGILTGDVQINADAEVLVAIQEIYARSSRIRKRRHVLIVDEIHGIFTFEGDSLESRSRAYIDSIRLATRYGNPVILLSATIGDPQIFIQYLERITNTEWDLYETDFRPTRLEMYGTDGIVDFLTRDLVESALIFVFSIPAINSIIRHVSALLPPLGFRDIVRIAKVLRKYKLLPESLGPGAAYGVYPFHSKMSFTKRRAVWELAQKGLARTLVSTSALGLGVNMPFRNVIFADILVPKGQRTYRKLTKTELLQMAGRAGRPGYFEVGHYFFAPELVPRYKESPNLRKKWVEITNAPLEQPRIVLLPNPELVLFGYRDYEQEIRYCARYSLPEADPEVIEGSRMAQEAKRAQEKRKQLREFDLQILRLVYSPELNILANMKLLHLIKDSANTTREIPYYYLTDVVKDGYFREYLPPSEMSEGEKVQLALLVRRLVRRMRRASRELGLEIRISDEVQERISDILSQDWMGAAIEGLL